MPYFVSLFSFSGGSHKNQRITSVFCFCVGVVDQKMVQRHGKWLVCVTGKNKEKKRQTDTIENKGRVTWAGKEKQETEKAISLK